MPNPDLGRFWLGDVVGAGRKTAALIISLTNNKKKNIILTILLDFLPGKQHVDTNSENRERILSAAQQLFEQSGRKELPTVDAVRKLSKTNMNDASAVMKEWRRLQIVSASAAVVVRDSVDPFGPVGSYPARTWRGFLAAAKAGAFPVAG